MRGDSVIPTAACPISGRPLILPASIWQRKAPVRVNCPACGAVHVWCSAGRLLAVPEEDRRPAGSTASAFGRGA